MSRAKQLFQRMVGIQESFKPTRTTKSISESDVKYHITKGKYVGPDTNKDDYVLWCEKDGEEDEIILKSKSKDDCIKRRDEKTKEYHGRDTPVNGNTSD